MAGDWIKMRVDLRDDPAVFRMAEALDIDELQVVGHLFCFWAWADKHAVDGRVDGATPRLVDKVSMASGFADALVSVGWLSFDESGLQIPNFERHNGETAKERGLKNARQARWRAKKDKCVDGQASTGQSTNASTREEKRREDIYTPSTSLTVCQPEVQKPKNQAFDAFWLAYPKKVGKGDAEKAWKKIKTPAETLESIKAALCWQVDSDDWKRENGKYIPHPATYLNGRRWEDDAPIDERAAMFAGSINGGGYART